MPPSVKVSQRHTKKTLLLEVKRLSDELSGYKKREKDLNHRLATSTLHIETLRIVTENIPAFISYVDKNQRYRFVNNRYKNSFGGTHTTFVGRHIREIIGHDVYRGIRVFVEKALAGEAVEYETTSPVKDDGTVSAKLIPHIEDDKVTGFIAVIHDVTQAKKDQANLKKLQEYLDAILLNLPIGVAIVEGEDFEYFRINKYLAKLNGVSIEDLLNKPMKDVIPDADRMLPALRQVRETGIPISEREFSVVLPHRSEHPTHIMDWIFPITIDGEVKAIGGVVLDVSTQKRTQEELRLKKNQIETQLNELNDVYNSTPVGMAHFDTKLRYIRINQILADINGYPVDAHIGKSLSDIVPELASSVVPLAEEVLRTGVTKSFEVEGVTAADPSTIKTWYVHYSPVKRKTGAVQGLNMCVQDISLYKALEKDLMFAKEKAESANRAKTRFLANMSHEIRTPLGAISGLVHQLTETSDHECIHACTFAESLGSIKLASQNLTHTVNHILELSKIESGKVTVKLKAMDLKDCVASVIAVNQELANAKHITIHCNCDALSVKTIVSDVTLLSQLLMNLLNNAVKFSPEGRKIEVTFKEKERQILQFEVSDVGPGIPNDKLDTIFESFEQADSSITREYGGTGLGLAICKRNIALLNGTIQVESTLGHGTTFTVRFPYILTSRQHLQGTPKVYSFSKEKHVLLVEDDVLNQDMMKKIFSAHQISFELASSGEEALALAKQKPAVILMDLHMPDMDGTETTKRLLASKEGASIPVYALTADIFVEENADAQLFRGIITKPIDFDRLLGVLGEHLGH